MIAAAKSRWWSSFLARDAEKRIRGAFQCVRLRGLESLESAVADGPVLVISNHTSWWDPLVLQWICQRVLRADAYAMMNAQNLVRFPFFRKVGAFGVDLEDPRDGMKAIRYSAKLLDRPGRVLWVFPQGAEVPITKRPLGFRRGAASIARLIGDRACVVPAAIRYEMASEARPHLWLSFGEPSKAATAKRAAIDDLVARQEALVAQEMQRIDDVIIAEAEGRAGTKNAETSGGFERRLESREGIVFRWASFMLAWLTRFEAHNELPRSSD